MIVNDPIVIAELTALAERYETALMGNDLPALDAMFWQSPHVVRLGVGENLYGIESIAAFRAARPGGSPPRRVLRTTISSFGHDHRCHQRRVSTHRLGHHRAPEPELGALSRRLANRGRACVCDGQHRRLMAR